MTVGKGGRALNLTSEGVFKTLKTINEGRGKKVSDTGLVSFFCARTITPSFLSSHETLVPASLFAEHRPR
jgi:hypothetical protein